MKSRHDILAALRRCKSALGTPYKILRMALFGSYARDEQTASSDVDVLVEVDPSIGLAFVDLAEHIEREVGVRVDVVSQQSIKPQYLAAITPDLIYV